jgi:hypothetical protein
MFVSSAQAHPARVSTLSGSAMRRIRPVIRDQRREKAAVQIPVSCCLSAAGISFSGRPVPLGSYAFLTVSRPGVSPDPNGVSTFHTSEIRPGWVPP